MISQFVDIPTDLLLELVVGILALGRPLTSIEATDLQELQCELERRMQTKGWEC